MAQNVLRMVTNDTFPEFIPWISEEESKKLIQSTYSPEMDNDVIIYPNPARNVLTIQLEQESEADLLLVIADMQGRLAMKVIIPAYTNKMELDISALPNSVYYCLFEADNKFIADKKLIIIR